MKIQVDNIVDQAGTGAPNIPDGVTIDGLGLSATSLEYYEQSSLPENPSAGAMWFNPATRKYYIYSNGDWTNVNFTPTTAFFGSRGLFAGGYSFDFYTIDYVTIATPGNSTAFGESTASRIWLAACSDGTYGLFGGGSDTVANAQVNLIDYVTIATLGNAIDFGDLTIARIRLAACSDGIYGLFGGGQLGFGGAGTNVIDYVPIATPGNAIDFGDLTVARSGIASCSDGTYGLFAGGSLQSLPANLVDYVTIATPGNATDFGDLTVGKLDVAGCSDRTYGLFGGGETGSSGSNFSSDIIDYVTIATPGNATDFGDLTVARWSLAACSDGTYGLFGGGGFNISSIDSVTIATPGNATYFGDLYFGIPRERLASCSGAA